MTLEEKIRERVNSGENLDSIMEEITSIANKIEQEKKEVGSRESYIKKLEDKFYNIQISQNDPTRDWNIAGIIMALNYADMDPNASKEDIEDVYEYGSKAIESLLDTAMEMTRFLNELFK